MNKSRYTKLLIIALCIGFVIFLYFQGRNKSTALINEDAKTLLEMQKSNTSQSPFDFKGYEKEVLKSLTLKQMGILKEDMSSFESNPKDTSRIRKLVMGFDKAESPTLSGYYLKQIAEKNPRNANLWKGVGERFFEAQGFFVNTPSYPYFVDESINAFSKALEINPMDFESKANLAANYIEGKQDAMKGVGILKSILQADSNNKKAIMYLGFLSMQSGQFPKAVQRFERLVAINPESPDYHRFLGEAYLKAGELKKGKRELENYKMMVKDPRLISQVNKILENAK